jgi:hypothetical protein
VLSQYVAQVFPVLLLLLLLLLVEALRYKPEGRWFDAR